MNEFSYNKLNDNSPRYRENSQITWENETLEQKQCSACNWTGNWVKCMMSLLFFGGGQIDATPRPETFDKKNQIDSRPTEAQDSKMKMESQKQQDLIDTDQFKAKVNDSNDYQQVWIKNNLLYMNGSSNGSHLPYCLRPADLIRVLKSKEDGTTSSVALYIRESQHSAAAAVIRLDFENTEEMDILCKGIKQMLKKHIKRERHREGSRAKSPSKRNSGSVRSDSSGREERKSNRGESSVRRDSSGREERRSNRDEVSK